MFDSVSPENREIYYRTPSLFLTQAVVDRYVDDLAFTFGVSRSALNVIAAAKGLATGAFSIHKANGKQRQCFNDCTENLVPCLSQSDSIEATAIQWVLVVEKEAIFRSLVSSTFWHHAKNVGAIVTGKGYPDLATRKLVRALSQAMATGPASRRIYGLVDSDPDGIGILSTYKHGSESLAHENAGLCTPSIEWLGIKVTDVVPLENSNTGTSNIHGDLGLIRLSLRDRRKATKMLQKSVFEDGTEAEWRRELQVMLTLNVKAEIEIMESREGGLASWLQRELGFGSH
ncbi:Spo11/DNA topoisomerase VI subunit A [Phyllosticta capitalensis]|uniref:DNA topoisomerase (ATP-hydrolyzing) n=1 Tax=Phyllosticta capitalensis TaxID=121624 RepID=A0ABR1YHH6_9PEZI